MKKSKTAMKSIRRSRWNLIRFFTSLVCIGLGTVAWCIHLTNYKDEVIADFVEAKPRVHLGGENGTSNSKYGILRYNFRQEELKILLETKCNYVHPVPNIVHYVFIGKSEIFLYEYISILSANAYLKPCFILIHGDIIPSGKWWNKLLLNVTNLVHVYREAPTSIFGKPIEVVEHKADVIRPEVLLEYGGIYLDSDMYVLRNFDPLLVHNTTLSEGLDPGELSNGVILSAKMAPFTRIWYLTYLSFNDSIWGYNSVIMTNILWKAMPEQLHKEREMIMLKSVWTVATENISWKPSRYSVHLYSRYFPKKIYEIEELNVLKTTFGALSRFILYGNKALVTDLGSGATKVIGH